MVVSFKRSHVQEGEKPVRRLFQLCKVGSVDPQTLSRDQQVSYPECILSPPYMPRSIQNTSFQICSLSVGYYGRVPWTWWFMIIDLFLSGLEAGILSSGPTW